MTDQDNYRPRSPDFSGFPSTFHPPDYNHSPYPLTSPVAHRASYDASPFFTPQYTPTSQNSYFDSHEAEMARRTRSQTLAEANQWQQQQQQQQEQLQQQQQLQQLHLQQPQPQQQQQQPFQPYLAPELPPPQTIVKNEMQFEPPDPPRAGPAIEVKTKFPVARIKRIMQADEDVGKVAQVTPIAVSKALELFMISLVTKASQEAKDKSSKRISAAHLKRAVAKDEVLDFLDDIISKIPDQPGKKDDDGSDQNECKKRKGGGRRKKEDSDDF